MRLRALALAVEVIYGTPASTRDPYDRPIDVLHEATARARVDCAENVEAFNAAGTFREGDRTGD